MKLFIFLCVVLGSLADQIDYAYLGETYAKLYFETHGIRDPINLKWFEHVASDLPYGGLVGHCEGAKPRELFWKGVGQRLDYYFSPKFEHEGPPLPHNPRCWTDNRPCNQAEHEEALRAVRTLPVLTILLSEEEIKALEEQGESDE